ncbi:PREDICTED: protein AKNAD1 [Chaetura pelagica]|uniref:protein AKNAD1 n=1 Tax=Chaetura pelagica TaxID=8897 RepID=UPI0005238166|nr:PREDICTED: protein AKNAD1 [Chaetura pelagica]
METTKKYELSDCMKTEMNSSFSDELGCITDATEEEQDDLPYDGDIGITCKYSNSDNLNDCTCGKAISGILNLACSEDNNIKATAKYETHPQLEEFPSHFRGATGLTAASVETPGREASFKEELRVGGFSEPDGKEHPPNSKMSNVFLHYFSKGELISTHQLIEYETIPETSITESINDTVNKPEPSEHAQGPAVHEQQAANFEEDYSEMQEKVNTGDKNQNSLHENRCVSKKPISSTGKRVGRQDNSQLIYENEDTHIFQNMKEEKDLLKKTVSPHELKYDQGQAHYCLADFSKAASEVKVPKRSDNINSVPTIEQPKSFPILLSKSLKVNNILENKYFNSAHIENQEEMSPELLQQLAVEDFSKHMTQETFFLQDNYPALNQLKRHLDALERNYLTAREQHRHLQLQNYKDKSINVGEFDPERKVEGEIFRLGMLLDDIQEQTDDSKSNLSSLITSYESAHSSYCLCESSEVSSPAGPPEGRGIGTAFVHKNKEEASQTTDVIPQTNQLSLKSAKCNICLHIDSIHLKKNMLLKVLHLNVSVDYIKNVMLMKKVWKGSDSEDISAYDSYKNSQSEELDNCESYRTLNTRICGERKVCNKVDSTDETETQILSATLDHAIRTANSLKKATERMVRTASEDLAKARRKQF